RSTEPSSCPPRVLSPPPPPAVPHRRVDDRAGLAGAIGPEDEVEAVARRVLPDAGVVVVPDRSQRAGEPLAGATLASVAPSRRPRAKVAKKTFRAPRTGPAAAGPTPSRRPSSRRPASPPRPRPPGRSAARRR